MRTAYGNTGSPSPVIGAGRQRRSTFPADLLTAGIGPSGPAGKTNHRKLAKRNRARCGGARFNGTLAAARPQAVRHYRKS